MENKNKNLNGKMITALSRSLRAIHQNSETLFRQNGLTMAQFAVLEALLHKGDMTVQALIDSVLSTSGNMTVVIRNLERQGLVNRQKNPSDNRSFVICLTKQGKKLIDTVFADHMDFVQSALSAINDTEKETVINILKKLQ